MYGITKTTFNSYLKKCAARVCDQMNISAINGSKELKDMYNKNSSFKLQWDHVASTITKEDIGRPATFSKLDLALQMMILNNQDRNGMNVSRKAVAHHMRMIARDQASILQNQSNPTMSDEELTKLVNRLNPFKASRSWVQKYFSTEMARKVFYHVGSEVPVSSRFVCKSGITRRRAEAANLV